MLSMKNEKKNDKGIEKVPTGIKGLDEITYGGLPKGRPTLICGNPGCGKTVIALEFLIRGAIQFNEPGVFIAFEETKQDLVENVASMGFDLEDLISKNLILIDYIYIDNRESTESGEYDLEGLFIRLDFAVRKINAKRVVLDTIEILFSSFPNEEMLRNELRRLFLWLKEKKLTTIVTGEQGGGLTLTRHGIEEYVADCVIALTHSLTNDIYTRRLQIIKYRGSYHETNQFPFLIMRHGIVILPITSLGMNTIASNKRISTGIQEMDSIMGEQGYYEGSSILISGTSGSGKTSMAGSFAASICKSKQRCLFFSYEESASEILRNLSSIGVNIENYVKKGNLKILSMRPTKWGLEKHLANFMEEVKEFKPQAVILDSISTFSQCGTESQVYDILIRIIDFLKERNCTLLMTILYNGQKEQDFTYGISSVIDTWLLMRNNESNGELKRNLLIIKSRGIKHSSHVWDFSITNNGIKLKKETT